MNIKTTRVYCHAFLIFDYQIQIQRFTLHAEKQWYPVKLKLGSK